MEITEDLSRGIQDWLSEKKTRSIAIVARLSDVSYSTVRRAAQNEGQISQEAALAIASVIFPKDEFRSFAKKHWPNLNKLMADVVHQPREEYHDIFQYLKSPDHLRLIVLASSSEGTTEDEVIALFGTRALEHLEDLKSTECLELRNGRWILEKDLGAASMELARSIISSMTKFAPKKNDFIPGASTAYAGWESLTPEATMKISNLSSEYYSQVMKICEDPENKGEVLNYFASFSNVLKGEENLSC